MNDEWRTSWHAFSIAVCDLYSSGMSDEDVTNFFAEKEVCWSGKVIHPNLHLTPFFVQLKMPKVITKIADGRICINDFVALGIDKDDVENWYPVKRSYRVKFTTTIQRKIGIPINQPGLLWKESDAETRSGYIKISSIHSKLVEIISTAPDRKKNS